MQALSQLSYGPFSSTWSGPDLNRRPWHFQCHALPTELPDRVSPARVVPADGHRRLLQRHCPPPARRISRETASVRNFIGSVKTSAESSAAAMAPDRNTASALAAIGRAADLGRAETAARGRRWFFSIPRAMRDGRERSAVLSRTARAHPGGPSVERLMDASGPPRRALARSPGRAHRVAGSIRTRAPDDPSALTSECRQRRDSPAHPPGGRLPERCSRPRGCGRRPAGGRRCDSRRMVFARTARHVLAVSVGSSEEYWTICEERSRPASRCHSGCRSHLQAFHFRCVSVTQFEDSP